MGTQNRGAKNSSDFAHRVRGMDSNHEYMMVLNDCNLLIIVMYKEHERHEGQQDVQK
jgi:hypothetical protein